MAEDTENAETLDQEPPKKTKRRKTIVYLYGAAADRRNRAARRSRTGRVPRQIRLGKDKKTVVRRNRRVPVTLDWVKENREELKGHIASGVIWLEDANRTRAPEEALKELGLWTDPREGQRNYPTTSKAAYNDHDREDAEDEESEEETDDSGDGDDGGSDDQGSDEDLENTPDDEDETGGLEDSEEDDDQDEEGDEPEGEDPEDDPSDREDEDTTPFTTDAPEIQPLPEGYQSFKKAELLALFESRGIEVPDDEGRDEPRNAVLVDALATWEDEHFEVTEE